MSFLSALIPLALLAVVAVLVLGIVSMLKGGEFNDRYGNRLMRWRVILQVVAVVLIGAHFVVGSG